MYSFSDGPSSDVFVPLRFRGTVSLGDLPSHGISEQMAEALEHAPCVLRYQP